MADLSKIKLNGVEYDLKDAIAREAIENIPQIDENKINKAWSIIEVDSGETTIVDIVPQQTINLTGNFETALVNNVNIPEEETECIVSFDLYEGQTLITSVSKNITTPYGENNDLFYFTFDNGNYEYNLIRINKEGNFGISIYEVKNNVELSSPYRVVNFHIQKEEHLMIPTMGWNSQAIPIPTEEDNNKILRYTVEDGEPIWSEEVVKEDEFYAMGRCPSREGETTTLYGITPNQLAQYRGIYFGGGLSFTGRSSGGTFINFTSNADAKDGSYSGKLQGVNGYFDYDSSTNPVVLTYHKNADFPDTSNFMVKGTDYVTAGQKSGTTLGTKATTEGSNTTASGTYAHAEGDSTIASENNSHAEGSNTTASGLNSHAEGIYTTASGNSSHAEGYYTTAQRKSQHVFGEYNILDTTGTTTTRGRYVEIVGKGTNNANRSNARTLDWSGNEVLAGKLTIGAAPTANMDVTTKQYVDNKITSDIATAIGGINQFGVAIITDLPTTDIDAHTIYFKSNSSSGNNIYDEYMYINSNWELIGSTQIDLTPYALSANLATVATSGNYNDLTDTPNLATVATSGDYDDLTDAPVAETDANVEDMLDDFDLDYTSNTTSPNYANGVSF